MLRLDMSLQEACSAAGVSLPVRLEKCTWSAGLRGVDLGAILLKSDGEILRVKGMGRVTMRQLDSVLAAMGLRRGMALADAERALATAWAAPHPGVPPPSRLLRLTSSDQVADEGGLCLVDGDEIVAAERCEGTTFLTLRCSRHSIQVKETVEEIAALLGA